MKRNKYTLYKNTVYLEYLQYCSCLVGNLKFLSKRFKRFKIIHRDVIGYHRQFKQCIIIIFVKKVNN